MIFKVPSNPNYSIILWYSPMKLSTQDMDQVTGPLLYLQKLTRKDSPQRQQYTILPRHSRLFNSLCPPILHLLMISVLLFLPLSLIFKRVCWGRTPWSHHSSLTPFLAVTCLHSCSHGTIERYKICFIRNIWCSNVTGAHRTLGWFS